MAVFSVSAPGSLKLQHTTARTHWIQSAESGSQQVACGRLGRLGTNRNAVFNVLTWGVSCKRRVDKGSWMVRQAVGQNNPVLLGKKLTTKYFTGPNYVEVRHEAHLRMSAAFAICLLGLAWTCRLTGS